MEQRSFQRYGRSAEIVYAWYIKAKRNKLYLLLLYLLVFKYIFINLFVITIFEFAEFVGLNVLVEYISMIWAADEFSTWQRASRYSRNVDDDATHVLSETTQQPACTAHYKTISRHW